MTAARLGPADRLPAARSREELRLAQVASGLLMLLDAYRLTGRLPLDVQVQTSRLRHAVKVVIQAEAARSPTPALPSPAAQGPDPAAAALRAWIAAQPWAQPGPVGWVYLLCFRDPATGAHRPLRGNGCRGQYAGHYWGKPASSRFLRVVWPVGGGEFVELAAGVWRAGRRVERRYAGVVDAPTEVDDAFLVWLVCLSGKADSGEAPDAGLVVRLDPGPDQLGLAEFWWASTAWMIRLPSPCRRRAGSTTKARPAVASA